ncbi:MAG: 16S rRNA (uracil(1498)-N(3))-methyltransferase [Elusimicrobia bacterium]|nr:16S rRNA (uracil(1498)-N(3))-methyltransferase [Elusimicrobiota bacterium]
MPQFLVAPTDIRGERFVLRGPEAFHVSRVMRCREGQSIEIFDGKGGRYSGVIERILEDGTVEGKVTGILHAPQGIAKVALNLYLGMLKASRWDWALEKATEVGVSAVIPVLTPRIVVQLREEGIPKKLERWKKILVAAAKQCGRADVPELREPAHFRDAVLDASRSGLTLVGWAKPAGASVSLHETLIKARQHKGSMTVNLFVGPEGGFTDEEAELAEMEGARLFHLGSSTLRGETAAVVAAAIVLHDLGAM